MSDITAHYKANGLAGRQLRKALRRHARIIRALDPDDARALLRSRAFAQVNGGKTRREREF